MDSVPGVGRPGQGLDHCALCSCLFPGHSFDARINLGTDNPALMLAYGNPRTSEGGDVEREGWGLWKSPSEEGTGGNRSPLTFVAGDQLLAFGLEVGRDEVAESMGQDVVCFIVDVLPTMGTGLKGQKVHISVSEKQNEREQTPAVGRLLGGERR